LILLLVLLQLFLPLLSLVPNRLWQTQLCMSMYTAAIWLDDYAAGECAKVAEFTLAC
jgi:hypothetical protein